MVTPACYSPADVRRYSRMNAYASYPERRAIAYPIHPDTRTTIMSERDMIDDVTPQRKRIAVACGRCRKRKIRCSGDSGNGGPCTNCKNAGYEPCQFLRVASQETPMKQEPFNYSLEASRQYQARGSSIVPPLPSSTATATPHYPDGLPLHTSDPFMYRSPTTFAYSTKPCYALSNWGHTYPDDQSIGYTMYPPTFPSIHGSDYGINYRIGSGAAATTKAGICVDTEPSYAYSNGTPAAATSLVHRSAPAAADSTSMTFQNMAAAGVNMGDRVLPMPVGRAALPSSMGPLSSSSSYRNDSGCSSIFGGSSRGSSQTSTTTSPASPDSETPSSYTSYETSSHMASAGLSSYPPMTLASQLTRTSNDLYTHAGTSEAASLFSSADSMRNGGGGPGPDLTYRYTDTTTAATTAAATSTARRGLPMLGSSVAGPGPSSSSSFSLGHHHGATTTYMAAQPASYMLPPGGDGAEAAADGYRKSAVTLR